MRNRLFLGVLGGLSLGFSGCAASAVEQARDADVDFVTGEPDASGTDDADDDGDDVTGRLDAGRMKDSGRPDAAAGDGGPADGAPPSGDAGPRVDSGVRDAGGPDASQPTKPDAGPADAGQPAGGDAGPPGCQGGTQMCGGQCVDTKTSNTNCGACGTVCNNGSTCSGSKCSAPITVPSGCTARLFENRTYAFCTNARSWRDARRACIDAKMDLARVTSNGESDFIKGNGDSWIAGNDLDREGAWVAPVLGNAGNNNGPALSFTRWNRGEPSNTQNCDGVDIFVSCLGRRSDEDCATVRGADGLWNDDECDKNRNFVCEPL